MSCQVTPEARADLEEIWEYIAEDNPPAADHLIEAFYKRFTMIAVHPRIGRDRSSLRPNMRSFTVRRHYVIFYRPLPHAIEVVRVIHGARNIECLFQKEEDESTP